MARKAGRKPTVWRVKITEVGKYFKRGISSLESS